MFSEGEVTSCPAQGIDPESTFIGGGLIGGRVNLYLTIEGFKVVVSLSITKYNWPLSHLNVERTCISLGNVKTIYQAYRMLL